MGGKKRRRIAQEAKDTAAASLASAQGEQAKAMADVQSQKAAYENFQFENPYGNLSMENFAEDLTVNTQQADFQAQSRAIIISKSSCFYWCSRICTASGKS